MDRNVGLLNSIYQNATLASQSIDQLLPKVEYPELSSSLAHQKAVYNGYAKRAEQMIYDYKEEPQEPKGVKKAAMWTGVHLNTMLDTSRSSIAELMIDGSSMGAQEMQDRLKEYFGCEKPVDKLGQALLKYEQTAAEELKRFL